MTYAFRLRDRGTARAARRIAEEQIGRALARLDAPAPLSAEEIHALRTAVKRLRGLLALIGPGLKSVKSEDRGLRDAGRAISAPRDSEVMLATLASLSSDTPAQDGLPHLRAALEAAHRAAHADHVLDAGLATYRAALEEALQRSAGWRLSQKGFDAVEEGLVATFAAAREDWHAARAEGGATALHETRKRIKAHGYHARLLEPIWPEMMGPHRALVDDLGETLGLINDLAVFTAHLGAENLPEHEIALARDLAEARHAALLAAVLPRADKLLSERPSALGRRWRGWWEIWRKEG